MRLDAARHLTSNLWMRTRMSAGALLTAAAPWATLDYREVAEPNVRAVLRWTAARDADAHGLCLWFDTELVEGIGFSGAPGASDLVYGHAFFPFPDPVPLRKGDAVETELRADLPGDEYVWSWTTEVHGEGGTRRFSQSSFRGSLISLDDLRPR